MTARLVTARLVRGLPLAVVIVGTWLLLQGEWSVANVAGGVGLAVVLLVLFPVSGSVLRHRVHPWELAKFLVFVMYSLVMSSWAVIKVILRPTPAALRSAVVRVRLEHESALTTTIVANTITLTPGTMTLTARLDPTEVNVHVLTFDDAADFRESVLDLERRTVAAFEPRLDDARPHHGSDS
jgi:multicomponent Na+:H+ antiporter subunit E